MATLKNFMEDIVFYALQEVADSLDMCTCKKCMLDVSAIALNNLPPKYVVTQKGELYSKADTLRQQVTVDVITAITKAAEVVRQKPRHNED